MRLRLLTGLTAGLLVVLALPAASTEATQATPPNRNDPCANGGKNTCGTTGVGFYKLSKYGQRWWGDFRGAVPGFPHTFCIDLRFWYPSPSYQYREDTSGALANREGESVPAERLQRMAYATWTFGRTADANRQAAVMLYVHSLMGDARPGELDPDALNPGVAAAYTQIARDSGLYHGPYRLEIRFADRLAVTRQSTASIRVLSATGNAVPGVAVSISGSGVSGLRRTVTTNGSGVATTTFTPSISSFTLSAKADGLASTLPRIFRPTTAAAAPNGQRIAVPSSQQISSATRSGASKAQIGVTTQATPPIMAVGESSTDRVTITATAGWHGTVAVKAYGPFASQALIRCDGTPASQGSFAATGAGTYTTPAAKLALAGGTRMCSSFRATRPTTA